MKANELLQAAAAHMEDRASTYDSPEGERSMQRTVTAFNAITGHSLSESDGWLLMQVLKDVRDSQRKEPHKDSLEDCIAYAALKAEARMKESAPVPVATTSGGWIDYDGKGNPFKESVFMWVRRKDGDTYGIYGNQVDWSVKNLGTDIVQYKLASIHKKNADLSETSDGWIPYDGYDIPVDSNELVIVKLFDGKIFHGIAKKFPWAPSWITHYKLKACSEDGWINYQDGVIPVHSDVRVYVKSKQNGESPSPLSASFWDWSLITHYKIA